MKNVAIAEAIRRVADTLTKSERRIAQELLSTNMVAGLETVAALSTRTKVSGPTVLRLVTKLGFSSFPAFQDQIRSELGDRLSSPLNLYDRGSKRSRASALAKPVDGLLAGLNKTFDHVTLAEIAKVSHLLAHEAYAVYVLGGRFSQSIAELIWAHLYQQRPRVALVPLGTSRREDVLIDIKRNHVVLAFDFRRYQTDTIAFCRLAHKRGAKIALITDQWLSPISQAASHIITCDVEAESPYDSLVSTLAVVECLVAQVTEMLGDAGRRRVEELEEIRAQFRLLTS